jgi:hypothetical protein
MTEAQWLKGADVSLMVRHLEDAHRMHRSRKGRRRLRLFTAACCRLVWGLMTDDRARQAVLLAERCADGEVTREEMKAAHRAHARAFSNVLSVSYQYSPAFCAADCAHAATISLLTPSGAGGAHFGAYYARCAAEFANRKGQAMPYDGPSTAAAKRQAALLRDVFGNPFRPVNTDRAWLRWGRGTVPKVAQAIYDERAFERLPILADALEDSGCTEQALLSHLRSAGPHVRGCWAVDAVLGRA